MQYIQANKEISRLHAESERITRERKHAYHHDKQLEELRNLQVKTYKTLSSFFLVFQLLTCRLGVQ